MYLIASWYGDAAVDTAPCSYWFRCWRWGRVHCWLFQWLHSWYLYWLYGCFLYRFVY
jgi:hypothetical protein